MSKKKSERLEEQVQKKLSQCEKLLEECVVLAEEGGFEFSFNSPGETYYPTSYYEKYSEEEALERIREDLDSKEFQKLDADELADLIKETREEMAQEDMGEYAEPGSWWMPSRNC